MNKLSTFSISYVMLMHKYFDFIDRREYIFLPPNGNFSFASIFLLFSFISLSYLQENNIDSIETSKKLNESFSSSDSMRLNGVNSESNKSLHRRSVAESDESFYK